MNELKSYTEYAVSTPTADFVIGFDFNYGEDAVNVTVDDVPATTAGYTVVYLNETTIRLSPSVPSGVVRLQRETDIDTTDNQFTAGAKFTAQTMDENFSQIRNSQQEVRDGFSKLKDDIGFTNLEQTVQAVHIIANEVEGNVTESRTLLADTTAQAVLAQGYANSADSANTAAQQAASDAQQVVTDVSTLEADVYSALDAQTQTVNTALSNLSTAANKFYPTLALANADIANIAVDQPVTVGEVDNGGLWYKATAGATTLTKSPYDPIEVAKVDATTKANAAEANANGYTDQKTAIIKTGFSANNNLVPVLTAENGYPILQARKNDGALFFTDPNIKIVKSFGTTGIQFIDENGYPILFGSEGTVTELIDQVEATLATVTPSITQLQNDQTGHNLFEWKYALSETLRKKRSHAFMTIRGDSLTQGSGRLSVWDELYFKLGKLYGYGGLGFAPINPDIIPSWGQTIGDNVLTYAYGSSWAKAYYASGTLPNGYTGWAVPAGMYSNADTTGDLVIGMKAAYKTQDGYAFDKIKIFLFATNADAVVQLSCTGDTQEITLTATDAANPTVTIVTLNNTSMSDWKIKKLSGAGVVQLAGQQLLKSSGGLVINRLAIGGMKIEHHVAMDTTTQKFYLQQLGCDLHIINLGQNNGGESLQTYKTNMQSLINVFREINQYGSLFLVRWHTEAFLNWDADLVALAKENDTSVIDCRQVIDPPWSAPPRGLVLTNNSLDPHLTEKGAAYVAKLFESKIF